MRRVLAAAALFGLAFTGMSLAGGFWEKKNYTGWDDKDIQKLMSDSPWAKSFEVSLSGFGGPPGGLSTGMDMSGNPGGGLSTGADMGGGAGGGGRGGVAEEAARREAVRAPPREVRSRSAGVRLCP